MGSARGRTIQLSMNLQETPAEPVEGQWRCTRCEHVYETASPHWARGIDPRFRYGRCRLCQGKLKTPATFVLLEQPRDVAQGETLKRAGMAAAVETTERHEIGWVEAFDEELRRLARAGEPFTSEDVTAAVGQPPSSGAVGARMAAAARRGTIVAIGHRKAERVNQHATEIKLWRGKL